MSILGNPQRHTGDVVITTEPIEKPDMGDWCCNGEPATLHVYANGRFHCTACSLCVDTVPGHGGGLRLDDVIPETWEAIDPNGGILLRVHASSAEEASSVYHSWTRLGRRDPAAANFRRTTARTLFDL